MRKSGGRSGGAHERFNHYHGRVQRTTRLHQADPCCRKLSAAWAVNNVLIGTYWQISKEIVARQQEQGWGARVIERLSADLRTAHPHTKGLSPRSREYMATLATRWPESIAQQPAARLPWGHLVVILDKCPGEAVSDFYARRAADEGWTREVLQSMIASRLHEQTQPALTTFDHSVPRRRP